MKFRFLFRNNTLAFDTEKLRFCWYWVVLDHLFLGAFLPIFWLGRLGVHMGRWPHSINWFSRCLPLEQRVLILIRNDVRSIIYLSNATGFFRCLVFRCPTVALIEISVSMAIYRAVILDQAVLLLQVQLEDMSFIPIFGCSIIFSFTCELYGIFCLWYRIKRFTRSDRFWKLGVYGPFLGILPDIFLIVNCLLF